MNKYHGFTLVETMVVSALLIASVLFFSQMFITHNEEKVVNFHVSEFMTLSNASRAYVHNIDGIWPGEVEVEDGESSCGNGFNVLETDGYFGEITGTYTFSCLQLRGRIPVLTIEYDFTGSTGSAAKDEARAKWVASMLPSASESNRKVKLYIPKPRVAQLIQSGSIKKGEPSEIDMPACRRPRLSTMIREVCLEVTNPPVEVAPGTEFNPDHLGGYRINVTEKGPVGSKQWEAVLEVSYASSPSVFSAENACEDSVFDYIVYCE